MMQIPSDAGTKILLVDDSDLARAMVAQMLRMAGYQVITADSGESALWEIGRTRPKLIISDVVMPGMSGYELCRRLRSNTATRDMPILMLTARGGIHEKLQGLDAGADDYMVKPFEHDDLLQRVHALLARSTSTEERQGRVVSVLSLRGGTGATVMAVNLAIATMEKMQTPITMADFSLEKGAAALALGLTPQVSVEEWALLDMHKMDRAMLKHYLALHSSGLRLLAASRGVERASNIDEHQARTIVATLRRMCGTLFVDMASNFSETNLALIDYSDILILPVTPDPASITLTRTTLKLLTAIGIPAERILVVLNWVCPDGVFSRADVEQHLEWELSGEIPYAGKAMMQAFAHGTPLIVGNASEPAARAFRQLAEPISQLLSQPARIPISRGSITTPLAGTA